MNQYSIQRPNNAHPDLPVHLYKREKHDDGTYGQWKWVNSYPTRELALGKVPQGATVFGQ